jgi:hypothetical protein
MPKAGFIPDKLKPWIDARQSYHLSHAQVQMARELGMNPKKFGGITKHRQELWQLPLPQFIEECFQKRFGRKQPLDIRSIEEREAQRQARRKASPEERAESAIATAGWCSVC